MFSEILKLFKPKPSTLITIAIIAAIGASCFYSAPLACLLIVAYCGYKCLEFNTQKIIRHIPGLSILLLCAVLAICSIKSQIYTNDLEKGCHIVSGVVTERHTSKGSKGGTNYHVTVNYEPRSGNNKTRDLKDESTYNNTIVGQQIIMAEPFSCPGKFFVLEYNPSDCLAERMRHGIYAKGKLSNLDNVMDNEQVRTEFKKFDKPGMLDFYKYHPFLTTAVLAALALVLSCFGDKLTTFSAFGGLALITLLSMDDHQNLLFLTLPTFAFAFELALATHLLTPIRVKYEIKRKGGFITTGHCTWAGSGKGSHVEVIYIDAKNNLSSEMISKFYEGKIIIAHSAYNDTDIICLDKKPPKALIEKYKNGIFIGPCTQIDLANAKENSGIRENYNKLYTRK